MGALACNSNDDDNNLIELDVDVGANVDIDCGMYEENAVSNGAS